MTEAVSCVSDSVAGCPGLERLYWKAYLDFVVYQLYKSDKCDKPDVNPPVTGKQCDDSPANKIVHEFQEILSKTIKERGDEPCGDEDDLCK